MAFNLWGDIRMRWAMGSVGSFKDVWCYFKIFIKEALKLLEVFIAKKIPQNLWKFDEK